MLVRWGFFWPLLLITVTSGGASDHARGNDFPAGSGGALRVCRSAALALVTSCLCCAGPAPGVTADQSAAAAANGSSVVADFPSSCGTSPTLRPPPRLSPYSSLLFPGVHPPRPGSLAQTTRQNISIVLMAMPSNPTQI